MNSKVVKHVLPLLIVIAAVFSLTQRVQADCDMWAWITTMDDSLCASDSIAYEESVKWYRYVSYGYQDDAICDDGWSVYAERKSQSWLDFRRSDNENQVYHSTWNNDVDGMDYVWAPYIDDDAVRDTLIFAMSHSRASGAYVDSLDPHPFIYEFNDRTLAMQHNGGLYSPWVTPMENLIGAEYLALDLFDRTYYNPPDDSLDSEMYGMLLMKNVLLADNYALGDQWAIDKTVNQIEDDGPYYSALNMFFNTGDEIYAAAYGVDNTHKLWKSFGLATPVEIACIVTGNTDPDNGIPLVTPTYYLEHWDGFDMITDETCYCIDADFDTVTFELDGVTDPSACEYAYRTRHPMIGTDAAIAADSGGMYVAVWANEDDSLFYRMFNEMGLHEAPPVFVRSGAGVPDVVFDADSLHFYIVYGQTVSGSAFSNIELKRYTYDDGEWTAETPEIINGMSGQAVDNPAIAWGDSGYCVTWEQINSENTYYSVRVMAEGDGYSMDEKIVGDSSSTVVRDHPDVLYVGDDDATFVVAFRKLYPSSTDSMCISRVSVTADVQKFEENAFEYGDSLYFPDLVLADEPADNRFACAYRKIVDEDEHQLRVSRFESPVGASYSANWYHPIENDTLSTVYTSPPTGVPETYFEVNSAPRDSGDFDVVFTYYDENRDENRIYCAVFQEYQGSDPLKYRIDDDASDNDYDPAVAIGEVSPGEFRRLILWNGYCTEGDIQLTANFRPEHFGTPTAGKLLPEDIISTSDDAAIVGQYIFDPAYPNPFNPETRMSFTLPKASKVVLNVYNVTGSLVAEVIDGWRTKGQHTLTFDGSHLPSGVYFARLQVGDFQQTRKLLLIK